MFQIVTYTADQDGYHAQVEYHGDTGHHHAPKTKNTRVFPSSPNFPPLYRYSPLLKSQISEVKRFKYSPVLSEASDGKSMKKEKSLNGLKKYRYSPLVGPAHPAAEDNDNQAAPISLKHEENIDSLEKKPALILKE